MWIDQANTTADIYVGLVLTPEGMAGGSVLQQGSNVLVWAQMFSWMEWAAWFF